MTKDTGLVHSLREQIVTQLRNDIYAGRLTFGERISEASLVARFNVSRTPIREALHQLTQEGLLQSKPNHGVRVAAESSNEIQELIIFIRRKIETFALQSCFDSLTEEDFIQWDEIVNRLAVACKEKDYAAIAERDLEFHHAIIQRAGIPDLEMIWRVIVGRVRSHFQDTQIGYSNTMDIYGEHAEILEVFRSGDRDAAIAILKANVG
ncbi:MAG: GntR family transcriptional regulator [Pirellulales bacterium]|nr:GntR family transcriptional regulator [Pirellulales bacterium]